MAHRRREHHREPALHVGRPHTVHHVAAERRGKVAIHGHGIGVAGEDQPGRPVPHRPRHNVVSNPGDRQVRERTQVGLDAVGQPALGVAHRLDIDERTGELQQVDGCAGSNEVRHDHTPRRSSRT
jgi:hypothetical protein